ncbi:hypothetical protein N7462_005047 [Penicillium macrosclerotiorum]|uniref:uncharacterized protein n=1 Tax=Penicillium macrosclerotiorum TaxID=303699 RepID=UPI0025472B11|nr:uncharacterized protein N7462_005047 [Penicillium macrosclerotiorum]KAJ5690655.1 hypothetical protein N7462_005047 [Penicillium macrosclerotiorum]
MGNSQAMNDQDSDRLDQKFEIFNSPQLFEATKVCSDLPQHSCQSGEMTLSAHQHCVPVGSEESPLACREARYSPRPGYFCSHETVLRCFGLLTRFWCRVCHRTVRFLYVCTADTADFSPFDPAAEPIQEDLSILAPWVQKGIAAGEYTNEQVQKLLDQKMKVLTFAKRARRSVAQHSERESIDNSGSLANWLSREALRRSSQGGTTISVPLVKKQRSATCRLQACGNCEPGLEECAWGSIDAIANEPYTEPPRIPEYLRRPISDASKLRTMTEHRFQ